jgi:hypothetical protein
MPKEYIDRDKILPAIEAYIELPTAYENIEREIRNIPPAADVAPVVHGEWVESPKKYSYYQYRCSVCGFDNYSHITRNGVVKLMKYCPNCGAKMKDEQ